MRVRGAERKQGPNSSAAAGAPRELAAGAGARWGAKTKGPRPGQHAAACSRAGDLGSQQRKHPAAKSARQQAPGTRERTATATTGGGGANTEQQRAETATDEPAKWQQRCGSGRCLAWGGGSGSGRRRRRPQGPTRAQNARKLADWGAEGAQRSRDGATRAAHPQLCLTVGRRRRGARQSSGERLAACGARVKEGRAGAGA